jgi:ABC-type sulfate transport system permease subunit
VCVCERERSVVKIAFLMGIIVIIIVIMIIFVITFMHGINNYISETNHVSTVYGVAAVLYLCYM